eukprot:18907-Heterococcus_DN1.PRE.6
MGDKLVVGLETNCVPDLNSLLDDAREEHFDFVSIPLVHPRYQRDALGVSDARDTPLTRSDLLLDSKQWGSLVVGKVSECLLKHRDCLRSAAFAMIRPNAAVASNAQIIAGTWIDLDSTCQETRRASEAAFKQELAW